jgi:hypothetical protein
MALVRVVAPNPGLVLHPGLVLLPALAVVLVVQSVALWLVHHKPLAKESQ